MGMRWSGAGRLAATWVVLAVFAALSGCGGSSSTPDDQALLDGLHFGDPLNVAVNLGNIVSANGQVLDTPDTHIAAILLQAGYLKATPDADNAPWYRLDASHGSLSGQIATIEYGKRVITGHSDARSWTEGPVQLYAETISYQITLDPAVEEASKQQAGADLALAFQLRLVARNDPSIGHWVASFNASEVLPPADLERAVNGLARAGDLRVASARLNIARTIAFDQIEARLAAAGTLARSPNPNILLSPSSHIAIWKTADDIRETSLARAQGYCQSLNAPGYSGWRLPTADELRRFMTGGNASGNGDVVAEGHLIDTPDGRLWGSAGAPIFSNPINFVSRTLDGESSHQQWDMTGQAPPGAAPRIGVMTLSIFSNGEAGLGPLDLNLNPFQSPDFYQRLDPGSIALSGDFRMVCVSPLTQAPTVAPPSANKLASTDSSLSKLRLSQGKELAAASTPQAALQTAKNGGAKGVTAASSVFSKAYEHWKDHDCPAAESGFQLVLARDPNSPAANYYYADCLAQRGDLAGAVNPWRLAVQYGEGIPEGKMAEEAAKSHADQLSPSQGVAMGCAVPIIPPALEGATSKKAAKSARRLAEVFVRASDRFQGCLRQSLADLEARVGHSLSGSGIERKYLGQIARSEQDKQAVSEQLRTTMAQP